MNSKLLSAKGQRSQHRRSDMRGASQLQAKAPRRLHSLMVSKDLALLGTFNPVPLKEECTVSQVLDPHCTLLGWPGLV